MAENPNKNRLLSELAGRGVFQAVGIYVAVAWGSIEILITASERFGWPGWLGDAALILFLTGLPFIILLSWAFDLTGSGLKRMEAGSLKGKAMIAGTLTLVLGLAASWFFTREPIESTPSDALIADQRPVVAVMPFKVFSGIEAGELWALAFTDELINRINAHPDLVALDLNTVTNPLMAGFAQSHASDQAHLDFLVTGSLQADRNGVALRTRMTDATGKVVWDHQTVLNDEDEFGMRDAQAYMAAQVASQLGSSVTGVDYCEPSANREAVRLFYEARDRYSQRGAVNVATAAQMLEQALELDPQYARALALLSNVYERFHFHVLPEPGAYDMSDAEMLAFLESNPSLEPARKALALCPSLASAYYTVQTSIPAPQTFADAVDIIEEALRREPGNLDLRSRMVDMFFRTGHLRAAGNAIDELHRRDPLNPRNTHARAWLARMRGDASQALELETLALEMGYTPRNAEAAMAYDLVTLGDWAGLDELLGDGWQRSPMQWVDPRQVLGAASNAQLHAELVTEFDLAIAEADFPQLRLLVGNTVSLLMALGNQELIDRAMARYARLSGRGGMPWIIWHARYRQFWQDPVTEFPVWAELWVDFWDRRGAPDGCDWDGRVLDCEWTETR